MSEERLAALEKALANQLESGGAQVTVQDPRVSRAQNWLIGLVGLGIISGAAWVGTSINSMRDAIVRLASQNEYLIEQLKDHNDRLKELERRRGP